MRAHTADAYYQPLFGGSDELFNRCLKGSSILGLLLVIAIFIAPAQRQVITEVTQLPKRMARLLLEETKPAPAAEFVRPEAAEPEEEAAPEPRETPVPRARQAEVQQLPPDAGRLGRQRAEEVRAELAATTSSLQSTIDDLSASLQSSKRESSLPVRSRRSRSVRSGRGTTDIPSLKAGLGGGSADLTGSAVKGSRVAIGTLAAGLPGGGGYGGAGSSASGGSASGSGAAPGVYRSNASLLAVIQKYAAGIHYCYANELKHNESLRGKLVVAMTVAASGEVVEATVVENTLGSSRLAECALSQIRDWKFPPIEKGLTSFQAPFVFTPPK